MRLIYDQSELVAKWVALHIPQMAADPDFGLCYAVGVVDKTGIPVGGVVWHNYLPQFRNIEVSCASETSRWLTKSLVSEIFEYAFDHLSVARITAITPAQPTSASRFLERFGFRREGLIRKGLGDDDAVVWGLLDSEWKWCRYNRKRPVVRLKRRGDVDGQECTKGSDAGRSSRNGKRPKRRKYSVGASSAEAQPCESVHPIRDVGVDR